MTNMRALRSYTLIPALATMGVLLVLAGTSPTAHAQVGRAGAMSATAIPKMAVRPRVYTRAQLISRLRALPNGVALLSRIDATGAGQSSGGTGSAPSVQPRMLTTSAGSPAVGSSGTLGPTLPSIVLVDNALTATLRASDVDVVGAADGAFAWSLRTGSQVHLSTVAQHASDAGSQMYVVLFDLQQGATEAAPDMKITVTNVIHATDPPSVTTCTSSQLLATRDANHVVTCAAMVTHIDGASVTASIDDIGNQGGAYLASVSIMRVQ